MILNHEKKRKDKAEINTIDNYVKNRNANNKILIKYKIDMECDIRCIKMKYHIVIVYASAFLEKASYRKSNIFSGPVRIPAPKCFKPEMNRD